MTNEGPLVAVIDSGVDYNHPALSERIWINPSPYTDPDGNSDTNGWDFVSGDPRPYDDGYHGTEVASMIVGVAPLVHIMPVKVFNPFGITSSAAIFGAFKYAVDHGAKIVVAAWATQLKTKTLDMAMKYAHDHGVVVVVSAGDRGDDLSKAPSYPVTLSKLYDNVIAVTGVDTNDALVKVTSFFANFDPASVAIAAPGQNILTAQPRHHTGRDTSSSLAAGLVAGAIARDWAAANGAGTYVDWIKAVKQQSQAVPGLASAVQGGLRLRVK
jgi:subtilisin family serine protease